MTCAETVRAYLLTLSPVTALVNTRIWTFRLPQSPTLPAVLVQQIGDTTVGHLRGVSRWQWARIQVDCLGTSAASARALDQAVRGEYVNGAATGLRGADGQIGSPAIRLSVSHATSGYLEWYEADELKQSRVTRDYQVWIED